MNPRSLRAISVLIRFCFPIKMLKMLSYTPPCQLMWQFCQILHPSKENYQEIWASVGKKKTQQQIDFLLKVEKCSCWWLNYSVIWKRLTKNFINYTHFVFKLFPLEEILNRSCNDLKRPVLGSGKKVYLFGWSLLVKVKE